MPKKANKAAATGEQTHPLEIDKIFRENSGAILQKMTGILEEHGIKGYSVHSVQIAQPPRPNPDICIPYISSLPDGGWEFGCSYVEV